jgi:iron complex transport system ATP-binding protein
MLYVRALSAGYPGRPVLEDVDLHVERGEMLALIGPNGCGKTTLLRAITGILPFERGSIEIAGTDIRRTAKDALARRVAVVAQAAPLPSRFTAFEVAMMGRAPHLRLLQWESRRDARIVRDAMERSGCWRLRERMVDELSGGERQRVIIARALAQEPELLLLDEPTSHLDLQHQVETFQIVGELCAERALAVVAVVHDLTLAAMFADRIALLAGGRNVATGTPAEVLDAERIQAVYGVRVRVLSVGGRPVVVPDVSVVCAESGDAFGDSSAHAKMDDRRWKMEGG